ncbi:MAG: hypothetical protein JNL21_35610 [Myxococcales bacterium]|nr:hypothetical protein [Myxococcales bacterium]
MPDRDDIVRVRPDPRLPEKPVDPHGGAPRGFSVPGFETRTYGPTNEALKNRGLQLCKENTPGNIYFVCPLSQEEIDKRKAQREISARGPQGTQESWERSLPPDRPQGAGTTAGSSNAVRDFDGRVASEREAASLDKVFCGGVSGSVEIAGHEVAGGRIGGRECREADLLNGDGGDATIGHDEKREVTVFGVAITVKGGAEAGADPVLANRRLATEAADAVADGLAKPVARGLQENLRRKDQAGGF